MKRILPIALCVSLLASAVFAGEVNVPGAPASPPPPCEVNSTTTSTLTTTEELLLLALTLVSKV